MTLDDEFHRKDFISHKQKFSDIFGIKIDLVPLSKKFKKKVDFLYSFGQILLLILFYFYPKIRKKKSRIYTKYSRNRLRTENSLSVVENL